MQIKRKWGGKNTKNLLIQELSPGSWELLENWKCLFTQIKYQSVQYILKNFFSQFWQKLEWVKNDSLALWVQTIFLFSAISHQIWKRKWEKLKRVQLEQLIQDKWFCTSYPSFEEPDLFQAECLEFYVVASLVSLHTAFSVFATSAGCFLAHLSASA